jgi:hypothetical protein
MNSTFAELEMGTARGRATFEEVEEFEVDRPGFEAGWPRSQPGTTSTPRAAARPELNSPGRRPLWRRFAEAAMAADDQQPEANLQAPRLRAIEA